MNFWLISCGKRPWWFTRRRLELDLIKTRTRLVLTTSKNSFIEPVAQLYFSKCVFKNVGYPTGSLYSVFCFAKKSKNDQAYSCECLSWNCPELTDNQSSVWTFLTALNGHSCRFYLTFTNHFIQSRRFFYKNQYSAMLVPFVDSIQMLKSILQCNFWHINLIKVEHYLSKAKL